MDFKTHMKHTHENVLINRVVNISGAVFEATANNTLFSCHVGKVSLTLLRIHCTLHIFVPSPLLFYSFSILQCCLILSITIFSSMAFTFFTQQVQIWGFTGEEVS